MKKTRNKINKYVINESGFILFVVCFYFVYFNE